MDTIDEYVEEIIDAVRYSDDEDWVRLNVKHCILRAIIGSYDKKTVSDEDNLDARR